MSISNDQLRTQGLQTRGPFTDGTNDSNVRLLSMGLTHAAMTLPAGWAGKWVTITVRGTATKSGWFLFSQLSTAEVDRTITATSAGAPSAKLGQRIAVGETVRCWIQEDALYLINETDDVTTTAELVLSSY